MNEEAKKIIEEVCNKSLLGIKLDIIEEKEGFIVYKINGYVLLLYLAEIIERLSEIYWGGWVCNDGIIEIVKLKKQKQQFVCPDCLSNRVLDYKDKYQCRLCWNTWDK